MKRRDLIGMMSLAVFADCTVSASAKTPAPQRVTHTPAAVREPFVGIYRLAVYQPHGDEPIGRIQYDRGGGMWALLHPPGRPVLPGDPAAADYQATDRGLVAY